jgi:hypothetical protein
MVDKLSSNIEVSSLNRLKVGVEVSLVFYDLVLTPVTAVSNWFKVALVYSEQATEE